MAQFLSIIQLISAVLLIVFVLIQQRGAGLGGVFGGEGGVYRTKRGAEKVLFITTIVLAVVFVASSFLHVLLAK